MDQIYTMISIHIKESTNIPVINVNGLQKVLLCVAWASNWQKRKENQE